MSNIAWGNSICLSTPHYRATVSAIDDYFVAGQTASRLQSCALKAALALQFNLPHLCGLGGDAMVIERIAGVISVINGTGKTASHQHAESYRSKGLQMVPRRGIYSTMVYGAPYAFARMAQQCSIDLPRMIGSLLSDEFARGFLCMPDMAAQFQKALQEMSPTTSLSTWRHLFSASQTAHAGLVITMKHIAVCGFTDLYRGEIAQAVLRQIRKHDAQLYEESDFSEFTPNPAEVKSISFLQATIYCHGANSPWRELFLLLKMYELSTLQGHALSEKTLCDLAGHAEAMAPSINVTDPGAEQRISEMARALFNSACEGSLAPREMLRRQSHTVFIAGVSQGGDLIGMSNSIFTPLGALVEVEETGILLSNRCYAFNEGDPEHHFHARSPVKHSNNCVVVDTPQMSFVMGTSGGPVQSQTLSGVIHKIIAEQQSVRDAVHATRSANMGRNRKNGQICYLSECSDCLPPFQSTAGLSDKLGVVQVAGIEKSDGRLFAVADPRGNGIALGY
jgi:gamma-glutamyltranspeptidase